MKGSKKDPEKKNKRLIYYDWLLIVSLGTYLLFLVLVNLVFSEPLNYDSTLTLMAWLVSISLGLFFIGMLYNMIKRFHWIWFIITIGVSYGSYEYGNGYWWGNGIFIALLFYFVNLREKLKLETTKKV